MIAFCSDKRRRDLVLQTQGLNGIDYLEVLGNAGCGTQLALTFLKDARSLSLTPANVALAGDTTLTVTGIQPPTAADPLTLTVVLDQTGDFSPYTLTLVAGQRTPIRRPPSTRSSPASRSPSRPVARRPRIASRPPAARPTPTPAPDINYLARDYDGFRQVMLDRMAALVPSWTETHVADPGITMVEALAYAADRVSYLQDAVNTEAYIGTARSRISLRRHARLVDYTIQEGANARAWVCLTASHDDITVPAGTLILSPCLGPQPIRRSRQLRRRYAARQPRSRLRQPCRPHHLRRAEPDGLLHLGRRPVLPSYRHHLSHA